MKQQVLESSSAWQPDHAIHPHDQPWDHIGGIQGFDETPQVVQGRCLAGCCLNSCIHGHERGVYRFMSAHFSAAQ